mgnify:CR=1 FL=1
MARTTNTEIKELLNKLKQKMPNGDIAVLSEKIDNLQGDVKELLEKREDLIKNLYNPEDGVVIRVNKNTEYIDDLREVDAIDTVKIVDKMRLNYTRLVWGLYAMIIGYIFKEVIAKWFF